MSEDATAEAKEAAETAPLPFDRLIVTSEFMQALKPMARMLGSRGLMPTAKKGTLTDDVVNAMHQQADAVIFKADSNGFISAILGKVTSE